MEDIGLLFAWSLWLDGEVVSSYLLYGVKINHWGRAGKILQFIAALIILAEIVGSNPIRGVAQRIKEIANLKVIVTSFKHSFGWLAKLPDHLETEPDDLSIPALWAFKFYRLIYLLVCFSIFMYLVFIFRDGGKYWVINIVEWMGSAMLASSLAFLVLLLANLVLTVTLTIFSIPFLIILGIAAWILEREKLETLIKLISALMLITGFHFDLLAS